MAARDSSPAKIKARRVRSRIVDMIRASGPENALDPKVFNAIGHAAERGVLLAPEAAHLRAMYLRRLERLEDAIDEWAESIEQHAVSIETLIHFAATLFETFDIRYFRRLLVRYFEPTRQFDRTSANHLALILKLVERTGSGDLLPAALVERARDLARRSRDMAGYVARIDYRRAHAPVDAAIVSLGLHCLPWTVPNRWGMRGQEDALALEGPFDLAAHDLDTIIALLTEGFAAYTDPANIRTVRSTRGHLLPYNVRYKAVWNHHKGRYWIANRFARLTTVLERKIESLEECFRRPRVAFVIANVPFDDAARQKLRLLDSAISKRMGPDRRYLLFATTQADRTLALGSRTEISDRAVHYAMPYPSDDYVWHDDSWLNSAGGLQWESFYAQTLRSEMQRHGLVA